MADNNENAENATQRFERALAEQDEQQYVLKLYVTGHTPRSIQAIAAIRAICEEHLLGRYELQVIDIYQQPLLAEGEQIIAAPTLIKELPLPLRKLVGDMSNVEKVLLGLDLRKI
jgi:circadian clock protein KaiB